MTLHAFPRRIYWGESVEEVLGTLASEHSLKRVLVVTDKVLSGLDWFRSIIESLKNTGVEVIVYNDVPPEPPIDIGEKITASLPREEIDAIIAVGGGSVIDAAKAAKVKLLRPDVGVEDVAPFNPLGIDLEEPLLIAVPTTAGTGSDASYGIVLTKEEGGYREKIDVGSYEIIPYASILDPRLPKSAPRHIIVGAGLDALGHSIEALSSNQATPLTDALAERAAEEVLLWLPKAVGGDMEAMAHVHLAATMAGIAFTNGGLGLIHAIAHPLGAKLHIHHGTTVGIVTPYVVEYNSRDPHVASKYTRLKTVLEEIHGWEKRESLSDHIRAFYDELEFKPRLRDHGVGEEDFIEAKRWVLEEAYHDPSMAFAPIIPAPEELEEILDKLY